MSTPPILTLGRCKDLRTKSRDITAKQLAVLTSIPHERVVELESVDIHVGAEPWLDEAQKICAALRVELLDILNTGVTELTAIDTGFDLQHPLDVWLTGVRLPLRYGIRLAITFGLDNPFDLLTIPSYARRIWSTLEAGERLGAPGVCPYCAASIVGGAGHFPSCTPAVMFGARDAHLSLIGSAPKPHRPHRRRGGSARAPGLLILRTRLGITQEQIAASLEIAPMTYYKLEKMRNPLTQTLADKIAALYKVPVVDLFSPPGPPLPPPAPTVSA